MTSGAPVASGGTLSETWKTTQQMESFGHYLLLLGDDNPVETTSQCCNSSEASRSFLSADPSSVYASKKLVMELLYPKVGDLDELCQSWTKKSNEGGVQISFDRYQSLLTACVIGAMLLPQIQDLNSTPSSSIEPTLVKIAETSLSIALQSVEPAAFVNLTLRTVRSLLPDLNTASLVQFQKEHVGLLQLLVRVWEKIEGYQERHSPDDHPDSMDIDDEFDSQGSKAGFGASSVSRPRRNIQMSLDMDAFHTETRSRLAFLQIIDADPIQIGLVPDGFLNQILEKADDELLSCQNLLVSLFHSDLVVTAESALKLVERLGSIISQLEYQTCEVALSTCIEVIDGLCHLWLNDQHHLSEAVGDLYNHFIKVCMSSNIFSLQAKISMAQLLFTLLRSDPDYGGKVGLDSCRTSLLCILRDSSMIVKISIADRLASIFELFILKLHDDVFVDILDSLPTDADDMAGIAFRLLVLSKLACRWPTLLRRCTYHIFETPGKIPNSTEYATRCLVHVSSALSLESPRDLFCLFSRQLLFTWLESDLIEDIPFSIFGFGTLADLLRSAQAEAVGLTIMRGQEAATTEIAGLLGTTEKTLIQENFTTAIAFSMMQSDQFSSGDRSKGEDFIKRRMGSSLLVEAIYAHFVDIIALFFDLIDQENPIEKWFLKNPSLQYAGNIMKTIKTVAHSPASLPPNQQPMFKAKYLIQELSRLCQGTEIQPQNLWTPALVVSVARKLLNTVHPSLGSLHACAVLRKVRILICLAGPVALVSYPLEMLLNSTRAFIVDSECADDALGISQYLLAEGAGYLVQTPSFLAGYALSTLASLRVFLESSQSSTTQESQFKATMSKAQQFHNWFNKYLQDYESSEFKTKEQRSAFQSITASAAKIRSSGNAESDSAESKLLLDILEDESLEDHLLDESSREVALGLLCGEFSIPESMKHDVIATDDQALKYATAVWKSCKTKNLSAEYLSWAGRVVGRSFSASGDIPEDILRESQLHKYQKIAPGPNGSEMGLLYLLQDLTSSPDSVTAGLAEAALRTAVSQALVSGDEALVVACQRTLAESLFHASQWGEYQLPPSEKGQRHSIDVTWPEDITSSTWLSQLSTYLAKSAPDCILLSVLPPILAQIEDFAEKAFPFVVHLVLTFQMKRQETLKRTLSESLKDWLQDETADAKDSLKLLMNTLLYLRTQEYPNENSIADRSSWLEVDYARASCCASRNGMHKTGLLFAEIATSDGTRTSRKSLTIREGDISETLLTIFENIDDPDAYYGLPEDATLLNVLSRVEYENEGPKSLAFRGAQYDSHIRLRNPASGLDGQALVKALSTLGLSGLSHSLLQNQQSLDATPESLDNMFSTARKLEIWNLPTPDSGHHAVTTYKAYQSIQQASSLSVARSAIHDGLSRTMESILKLDDNATALRRQLSCLASLTEIDDVLSISDSSEIEAGLSRFEDRSGWMRSGL